MLRNTKAAGINTSSPAAVKPYRYRITPLNTERYALTATLS